MYVVVSIKGVRFFIPDPPYGTLFAEVSPHPQAGHQAANLIAMGTSNVSCSIGHSPASITGTIGIPLL
jgi:hypothetical protein